MTLSTSHEAEVRVVDKDTTLSTQRSERLELDHIQLFHSVNSQ